MPDAHAATPAGLGLGLDAGGTGTRWALAHADGSVQAEGQVAAISGLQLMIGGGRAEIEAALAEVAAATGRVRAVVAGVTGIDAPQAALLGTLIAAAFDIEPGAVRAMSDIELACHAAFAPGAG